MDMLMIKMLKGTLWRTVGLNHPRKRHYISFKLVMLSYIGLCLNRVPTKKKSLEFRDKQKSVASYGLDTSFSPSESPGNAFARIGDYHLVRHTFKMKSSSEVQLSLTFWEGGPKNWFLLTFYNLNYNVRADKVDWSLYELVIVTKITIDVRKLAKKFRVQ